MCQPYKTILFLNIFTYKYYNYKTEIHDNFRDYLKFIYRVSENYYYSVPHYLKLNYVVYFLHDLLNLYIYIYEFYD